MLPLPLVLRVIHAGFQDYEGLGIKRSTADSKHVPSPRSRLLGNNAFWSLPQKVVEFLELTGASGDPSKSRKNERHAGVLRGPQGLVQVRIVQNVPEPSYDLLIGPRFIRRHKLDLPQCECEK
jgi:hypothetical protein